MIRIATIVTIWAVFALYGAVFTLAGDYQLPDTGIDKCYDNNTEIPCPSPGQPFYGQDAQYDGPQPAFRDNGNGTVTDLNTGLMWQQGDDGTTRTWQGALDYCEALTLPAGGYSDWRLPNRRELMSIVDYGRRDTAIDTTYFPECRSFYYWSSNPHQSRTYSAWCVDFGYGGVDHYGKFDKTYVRCVRGGP